MQTELGTTLKAIDKSIIDEYTFWREIYEGVYSDVDVKDGENLNIVRNHILYEKMRCEEILGDNYHLYPDSYFFPVPAELPNDFMVSTRKMPLPVLGMIFNVVKNPPIEEVFKFEWAEELC